MKKKRNNVNVERKRVSDFRDFRKEKKDLDLKMLFNKEEIRVEKGKRKNEYEEKDLKKYGIVK